MPTNRSRMKTDKKNLKIIKSSGEKAAFSYRKLRASLLKSGAGEALVDQILKTIEEELYEGISTTEVYNRAYALLEQERGIYASKYKLKKAIYELGPTGFPFERFVAQLLRHSGHKAKVGAIVQGQCVRHEVDVLAQKDGEAMVLECKFHADASKKCNVKIPLYIHSRYQDIKAHWNGKNRDLPLTSGWVVTNTQFTRDAIDYGKCAGLSLLSWDYPKKNALKDRIDRLGLYPITVSTLLSSKEKEYLLGRDLVLLKQLSTASYVLDHMGASPARKKRILEEVNSLCNPC